MKRQTKPNQFSIFQGELCKVRNINAIRIDSENKKINSINIENNITYIQRYCDFFKYEQIFIKDTMECIFVGIDKDLEDGNSFKIKGITKTFYGNAILVKIPKSRDLHKLQNTKQTVEYIKNLVEFNN